MSLRVLLERSRVFMISHCVIIRHNIGIIFHFNISRKHELLFFTLVLITNRQQYLILF